MDTYQKYAPLILRIGLSALFVWFGMEQILDGLSWVSWVPEWAVNLFHVSPALIVMGNGFLELGGGVLLAFGVFTRFVALILAIHTLLIAFQIGITAIGVRDMAIVASLLSLSCFGRDRWSLL